MILVQIQRVYMAHALMQSAKELSQRLGKQLMVVGFADSEAAEKEFQQHFSTLHPNVALIFFASGSCTLVDVCEQLDASFLMLQLTDHKFGTIKQLLKNCRDLRIPYLFFKPEFPQLDLRKVILPIGFLEEELEKAQFASAFGRFCDSEIHMLLANDYGTKAKMNAEKMSTLFDKFELIYNVQKAKKDSFKVEMEATEVAILEKAGLIIVSASRDYGLDDIIFGPKELHVVRKSELPVLLINPRGDLYALCD